MDAVFRWFGLDPFTAIDRITGFRFIAESHLPAYLVWGVVAVGLAMAAINFLPIVRMQRRVRVLSFFLRLGMVALFLVLLLRAHLNLGIRLARDPAWLALVDDSGSMTTRDVGDETRFSAALADLKTVRRTTGSKVSLDVATLSGDPLGDAAGARTSTRIHQAILRELAARPRLQRLVLLTDGRDAVQQDFSQTGAALKARGVGLDVVLYGTAATAQDSRITAKPERSVIRLGESLIIRGALTDVSGKMSCALTLQEDGKTVRQMSVPRESYDRFEIVYKPEKAGMHRYTLAMQADDINGDNNVASFFADIRDEKINVLLIEGIPRFEFKLMKVVLETDPLVHLVSLCHLPGGGAYAQGIALHANVGDGIIVSESELYKYDIVILRDVPRTLFRTGVDQSEMPLKLLVSFVQKRGGGLVTTGGQSVFRAGGYQDSPLMAVLPFDLSNRFSKESQFPGRFVVNVVNGQYDHPLLRLLPDPVANRELWNALPMLDGCNNVGGFKAMAKPLLSRFAKIRTPMGTTNIVEVPVLAYQDLGEGKILGTSVDTLWRWQLQPDLDPPPLEALMANIIRYLAPEPGSRAGGVNVRVADPTPQLGQTVVLSSLLRDKNYEPLRMADLKVVVTKPDGKLLTLYPCDLPERPGYYEYRVLADQPGDWSATAILGKDKRTTRFSVRGQDDEYADLAVDRDSMQALADAADGTLVEDLKGWMKRADLRPVTEPAARDLEVWNSPAVLVLFILLVCVDCYVRKRQGMA